MSCCGVMDFGHGDVHSPMCILSEYNWEIYKNIIDYKQLLWYLNSVDRGNESGHLGKVG